MEALKREVTDCVHVWEDVCAAFSPRLNAEGVAVRCGHCGVLGFQRARTLRVVPENRLKLEYVGEPTVMKGIDIFQAEYFDDGRPLHVWDAHL
jgi:hypothetical protein